MLNVQVVKNLLWIKMVTYDTLLQVYSDSQRPNSVLYIQSHILKFIKAVLIKTNPYNGTITFLKCIKALLIKAPSNNIIVL